MEPIANCEVALSLVADEEERCQEAGVCQAPPREVAAPESSAQVAPAPDMAGDFPSRGSKLHSTGECEPCAWFWRPDACRNGEECGRCHLCPEGEIKARKKKKVAMLKQGVLSPKRTSSNCELGEPLKVEFGMAGTFSEDTGRSWLNATGPLPAKLALTPMKVTTSRDFGSPLQTSSELCSTTSGSEMEEMLSGYLCLESNFQLQRPAMLRLGLATPKSTHIEGGLANFYM